MDNLKATLAEPEPEGEKHPLLVELGDRVRSLRTRRPMTRKALAAAANVSERHLANLEYGIGNASVLVLQQVAQALQVSLAQLLGDKTTVSPEWLLIREQLMDQDEAALRRVRLALPSMLASPNSTSAKQKRIGLLGLRGAGKTTLGQRLAQRLEVPFIELSREIENLAGSSVTEIQAMFGVNGYRRLERQALEKVITNYDQAVIATPGGLVSDTGSFNLLLQRTTTIWLRANPEDHMQRVTQQGDLRPIAASREAMEDLNAILAGRAAFYARADLTVDTSAGSLDDTFAKLFTLTAQTLFGPEDA
jgi:XRE family transcriptional regulator, aerobic/anaerobic benzoate catabolism transcriptional regulator